MDYLKGMFEADKTLFKTAIKHGKHGSFKSTFLSGLASYRKAIHKRNREKELIK